MKRQLTAQETVILTAMQEHSVAGTESGATGYVLACEVTAAGIATTEPGLHATAGGLIRRHLASCAGPPDHPLYRITNAGRQALQEGTS